MGRIRTIKPEFSAHEELSMLPAETHLLAAALLCYADDEGYFNANPVLLKAGTVPLRSDKTTIEQQLHQLEEIGYLEVRRSGVRSFGRVTTFDTHQKVYHPTASKFRDRFESLPKVSGIVRESFGPEGEQGMEQGTGNREAPTAASAVPASPPFVTLPLLAGKKHIVTQADAEEYQRAYPGIDVRRELLKIPPWLDAHPDKRSTGITGSKQRIVRWLGRTQDEGGRNGNAGQFAGKTGQSLNAAQRAGERIAERISEISQDGRNPALAGEAGSPPAGEVGRGRLLSNGG